MKVFHQKEKRCNINVSLATFRPETDQDNDQEGIDGEQPPEEEDAPSRTLVEAQQHACSYCGMKFATRGRLLMHMKFHKEDEFGHEDDYPCMVCGFICPDQFYLDQHLRKHRTAQHGCDECGMVFPKGELMLKHKRDRHPELFGQNKVKIKLRMRKKPGKNTCEVCGYTCPGAKELTEHLEKHKTLPYGCLECGTFYQKKKNLLKHLQQKHSLIEEKNAKDKKKSKQGVKKSAVSTKFRCEDCFYNAHTEEEFAEHREKHKVGPYGCDECGLVYTRKYYLDRHKEVKHGAPPHPEKTQVVFCH